MSDEQPAPKRIRLSSVDLDDMKRDDFIYSWKLQEDYVSYLEGGRNSSHNDDYEEKLRQQQNEATRKEKLLVMRLTEKEQELQDLANQLAEISKGQSPGSSQLHSSLLDPALNLLFQRMKKKLEETTTKLHQAQEDMAAWKFTSDSQTGKRLMSRCRTLLQENQELGKQVSQGKIAQLEAELAIQKKHNEELKGSQDELYEMVVQLNEEGEGMQTTICLLQQQLKEATHQMQKNQQGTDLSESRTEKEDPSAPNAQPNCVESSHVQLEPKNENMSLKNTVSQNRQIDDGPEPMDTQSHDQSGAERTTKSYDDDDVSGADRTTQFEEGRNSILQKVDLVQEDDMETDPIAEADIRTTQNGEEIPPTNSSCGDRTNEKEEDDQRNNDGTNHKDERIAVPPRDHDMVTLGDNTKEDEVQGEVKLVNHSYDKEEQRGNVTEEVNTLNNKVFEMSEIINAKLEDSGSVNSKPSDTEMAVNVKSSFGSCAESGPADGPSEEQLEFRTSNDEKPSRNDHKQDEDVDLLAPQGSESSCQDTPQDSTKERKGGLTMEDADDVSNDEPSTDNLGDEEETSAGKEERDDDGSISDNDSVSGFRDIKGTVTGTHHAYVPHLTPQSPTEQETDSALCTNENLNRNNHKLNDRTGLDCKLRLPENRTPSPEIRTMSPLDENVMNGVDDIDDINDDSSVLSKKHSPRILMTSLKKTNSTPTLKALSLEATSDGDGPAVDGN